MFTSFKYCNISTVANFINLYTLVIQYFFNVTCYIWKIQNNVRVSTKKINSYLVE